VKGSTRLDGRLFGRICQANALALFFPEEAELAPLRVALGVHWLYIGCRQDAQKPVGRWQPASFFDMEWKI
jgi:hypothetical protein